MIEFIIRESSVSTVSTKCEIAILQCQHTPTISGLCFFFIGKDIQVFLVLQNKCFLFLNLLKLALPTTHTRRNPLFEAVILASFTFFFVF